MLVKINPKILVWAREERKMTVGDIADKLEIDTNKVEKWESDGEDIDFDKLELIAKLLKRQTAVFFMPIVPPKIKKPEDYRNLAKNKGDFSPETTLAIRRTERYLEVSRELNNKAHWAELYKWLKSFTGKSEKIKKEVSLLRDILDFPIDEQLKQKGSDIAFRFWRSKIEEKLGIFVYQFPMPENEIDGFSYAFGEYPYAIVLKNKNASVRKIFTLFHELAHIIKHTSGACLTDEPSIGDQLQIEYECNNFAGNFLVPSEKISAVFSVEEIFKMASSFNISGEVYLRRLLEEKLINNEEFFNLLYSIREKSRSFTKKKQKGGPSMVIQSKSTRGNKFFNLVTEAAVTNKISFSKASDLLGLKVGSIRL